MKGKCYYLILLIEFMLKIWDYILTYENILPLHQSLYKKEMLNNAVSAIDHVYLLYDEIVCPI